jgi:hypothetical protein
MVLDLLIGALILMVLAGGTAVVKARRTARVLGSEPRSPAPVAFPRPIAPAVPSPDVALYVLASGDKRPELSVRAARLHAPDLDEHLLAFRLWRAVDAAFEGADFPWPLAPDARKAWDQRKALDCTARVIASPMVTAVSADQNWVNIRVSLDWAILGAGGRWQEWQDRWRLRRPTGADEWQVVHLEAQRSGSPSQGPDGDQLTLRYAPAPKGEDCPDALVAAVKQLGESGRNCGGPIGGTWALHRLRDEHHGTPASNHPTMSIERVVALEQGPHHVVVWAEGRTGDRRYGERILAVADGEGWHLIAAWT